jgi:hypothetical protein
MLITEVDCFLPDILDYGVFIIVLFLMLICKSPL